MNVKHLPPRVLFFVSLRCLDMHSLDESSSSDKYETITHNRTKEKKENICLFLARRRCLSFASTSRRSSCLPTMTPLNKYPCGFRSFGVSSYHGGEWKENQQFEHHVSNAVMMKGGRGE